MKKKHTLEYVNNIIKQCGYNLISQEYKNNKSKIIVQCSKNHIWTTRFTNIQQGAGCPVCAGVLRGTLEECQKIALLNNGKCLSDQYINNKTKMEWECEYGHKWTTSLSHIKYSGSWCPICNGRPSDHLYTLKDCIEFAKSKNGICLSNKYVNKDNKIKWGCENNHQWEATFGSIKNGKTWCPYCAINNTRLGIQECIEIANNHSGSCLSTEYINKEQKLIWQCENNHIWEAQLHNIKHNNAWCPHCINQISGPQKEIYDYLINNYQYKTILNDTQTIKPYDLDIYIPELRLAIEYDGEYWHYSDWAIENGSLERMARKDRMCKEKEIMLIRVREYDFIYNKKKTLNKLINIINLPT